jgi:Phage integrase family
MRSVLAAYEADVEAFGGLAERTKADYIGKLRLIERSFYHSCWQSGPPSVKATAYDGTYVRIRQSKTGTHVTIPAGVPLKRALDAAKAARGAVTTVLVTTEGMPWTGDGFRSSWRKACKKAGVTGLTFHDLRGSAITRLAIAGATVSEISTISGLSLGQEKEDPHQIT